MTETMSAVVELDTDCEHYVDFKLCWDIQYELQRLYGWFNVYVSVMESSCSAEIFFRTRDAFEEFGELPITVVGEVDSWEDQCVEFEADDLPKLLNEIKAIDEPGLIRFLREKIGATRNK